VSRQYFVAGTDTGVGKTRVCCSLLAAGRAAGHAVAGMKPVSAGLIEHNGNMINDDVVEMMAASGQQDPLADVNPYALDWPVSPHIAANRAGIAIDIATIVASRDRLARGRELLLIEGAGGWHAPISERATMADVARALDAPVLLVVGLKLGCLNHARLSLEAIRTSGLGVAGWVASEVEQAMAAKEENVATLCAIFGESPVFVLPFSPGRIDDHRHGAQALPRLLAQDIATST
jgi:dethiobiotin synthetase